VARPPEALLADPDGAKVTRPSRELSAFPAGVVSGGLSLSPPLLFLALLFFSSSLSFVRGGRCGALGFYSGSVEGGFGWMGGEMRPQIEIVWVGGC
jgi:hypothetical protein